MATYNKRGYKPKDKKQEVEQLDSTTAEVFNTLDESASKSEQWIEKNSKPLFYGLVLVAGLILSFLAYTKYVVEPTELEASNELAFPKKYFDQANTASGAAIDSLLTLSLEGADGNYGFLDIATTYSSTKAGNIANYYAGVSYLKMKNYEQAIAFLGDFSSSDVGLSPVAYGAIGDAFSGLEQYEDAISYYEKAAAYDNNFTAPLFLFKAAQLSMHAEDFSNAEKLFTQIQKSYAASEQGKDIAKHINSAKYAQ